LTKDARFTRDNAYRYSGGNMVTMTDNTVLKEAFKDAIREIVFENKEFLHEILVEAMEDVALLHAIEEGEKSETIDPKGVFSLLDSAQ
jgi:hypothetical protein